MSIAPFECQFTGAFFREPEILLLEIRAIDTDIEERAKAWVYIRREENYEYQEGTKNVSTARIVLTYHGVNATGNRDTAANGSFEASYCRYDSCISLTGLSPRGRGGVLVQAGLRGLRLGTYLFNVIIGWAKQWPEALANSIQLSEVDGHPGNRDRRNHFYEQFGLVFDYADTARRAGQSWPIPAGQLHQVTTWQQNITVHRVPEHLAKMLRENNQLRSELEAHERAIRSLSGLLKQQEDHPIRTALATLWSRYASLAGMLAILAILLVAGYYQVYHR